MEKREKKCSKQEKRCSKKKMIRKKIIFFVVATAVLTVAVMLLWNWLMPVIFGLTAITFWQALGLLALSKILFGGCKPKLKSKMHRKKREKMKQMFMKRMEQQAAAE